MENREDNEIKLNKLKNYIAFAYGADSDIYKDYLAGKDIFDKLDSNGMKVSNEEVLAITTLEELKLLQHRIKRANAKVKSYYLYCELVKFPKFSEDLDAAIDELHPIDPRWGF